MSIIPGMRSKPHGVSLLIMAMLMLAATAYRFSLISAIALPLKVELFEPISALRATELLGSVLAAGALGMVFCFPLAGAFLPAIGYRRAFQGGIAIMVVGVFLILGADVFAEGWGVFIAVWMGMFLIGWSNGIIESAINPLIAELYPKARAQRINLLHASWPMGLVVGGVVAVVLQNSGMDWKAQLITTMALPLLLSLWIRRMAFIPMAEHTDKRTHRARWRELVTPAFFLWALLIFFAGAAEIAPGQWMDLVLSNSAGIRGIWLLVFTGVVMTLARLGAGVVRGIHPMALLAASTFLAVLGLAVLSEANSPGYGFLGAGLWGAGVSLLWPTIIACAADRFPRSVTLAMSMLGMVGLIAIFFAVPWMGRVYDMATIEAAGGAEAALALSGDKMQAVLESAARTTFRAAILLPALMFPLLGLLAWLDRKAPSRN